jgi:regulation of enolase protein 1 (concanavalin A-like superfamily)
VAASAGLGLVLWPQGSPGASRGCVDLATDFASATLDARLTRTNDVDGTQTFELRDHRLVIHAPLGADARVDKQGRVTAPYLSLPVSGDFVVETTLSADPTSSYQGAGLLLLADQDNYVRLERGFGDFDAIAFEFARNGTHIKLHGPFNGDPAPLRVVADDIDLRLRRTGDQVTASWRETGEATWKDLRTTAPLAGDLSVGITALNTGLTAPGDAAEEQPFAVAFGGLSVICGDPA